MDEGDIWLEISNSSATIAGNHSRFLPRIRSSSGIAVIRRLSAAKHAAKPRRTNSLAADTSLAAADTNAVHRRVQA
jgi:hypothetical protein